MIIPIKINVLIISCFLLFGCSDSHIILDEFEISREVIIANNISSSKAYSIVDGAEELSSEIVYNRLGYVIEMIHYKNGRKSRVEEYEYNSENEIKEVKRAINYSMPEVVFRASFIGEREKVEEELIRGEKYRSVYLFDEEGKEVLKKFYKDSVLLSFFEYEWNGNAKPKGITKFSPDTAIIGQKMNEFERGLLVRTKKYSNDKLIEENIIDYNKKGLRVYESYDYKDDLKSETLLEYAGDILSKTNSKTVFYHSDQEELNEVIWRHETW